MKPTYTGSLDHPHAHWQSAAKDESAEPPRGVDDELERLRAREQQIMALIGCRNPDRLIHDLRNVLNELHLLRILADTDKT